MRHTPHTRRLSMASVDNSIDGAAGDASSGQEPIDVEAGSSPSPMNNEVRHFVFLLSWVQQEHSVNPYCYAELATTLNTYTLTLSVVYSARCLVSQHVQMHD